MAFCDVASRITPYASTRYAFGEIPNSVVVIVWFKAPGARELLSGAETEDQDKWYLQEADGSLTQDEGGRQEVLARHPGATAVRGAWTTDARYRLAYVLALEHTWP